MALSTACVVPVRVVGVFVRGVCASARAPRMSSLALAAAVAVSFSALPVAVAVSIPGFAAAVLAVRLVSWHSRWGGKLECVVFPRNWVCRWNGE